MPIPRRTWRTALPYVMITHPGLWMVRVEHQIAEAKPTHERYVARAVLVFDVKE
jgi:hypothetical protein